MNRWTRIVAAFLFGLLLTGYCSAQGLQEVVRRGRFPIEQNGKWGYIDNTGRVVIPPSFDSANDFHEGLALVTLGQKTFFINTTGTIVITPQYDIVNDFSEGLAAVNNGQVRNGIGLIANPGKWGYIDQSGKLVIPLKFTHAEDFSEGLAGVNLGDHDHGAFIDHTGKVTFTVAFDVSVGFHEGLVGALLNGSVTYYDRTGKKIPISSEYGPKTSSFSEGLLPTQIKNKWGYVDRSGAVVIAPQFEDAEDFSEGVAPVKVRSEETIWCPRDESGGRIGFTMRWGYIDKSGKLTIPEQFESADPFSEGLAVIHQCGKAFFIDKSGKTVIQGDFNYASSFSGGLARVDKVTNGVSTSTYIDKAGKIVWTSAK
jgi:hypothetical protein